MKIEKIEDLDRISQEPVLGREYNVPCILNDEGYIPINGLPHEDIDHFAADLHVHYDVRFLSPQQIIAFYNNGIGDCTDKGANYIASLLMGVVIFSEGINGEGESVKVPLEVQRRNMTCFRQMPKTILGKDSGRGISQSLRSFRQDYDGSELIDEGGCYRCPHRGFIIPKKKKGIEICSGHGLAACMKTKKIITI